MTMMVLAEAREGPQGPRGSELSQRVQMKFPEGQRRGLSHEECWASPLLRHEPLGELKEVAVQQAVPTSEEPQRTWPMVLERMKPAPGQPASDRARARARALEWSRASQSWTRT
jgi:hypothetical protein